MFLRKLVCFNTVKCQLKSAFLGRENVFGATPLKTLRHSQSSAIPDDLAQLDAFYPDLQKDLACENVDARLWFEKVIEYNVHGGKKTRGLTALKAYKAMAQNITEDGLRKAVVLGWCNELFHSSYIIVDDIIDEGTTRRSKPCWYRTAIGTVKVANTAIYDAGYLRMCIYELAKKYFRNEIYYKDLLDLFIDLEMDLTIGENLDIFSVDGNGRPRFDDFNKERYNKICYGKAGYTFYLPISGAMYLAGIAKQKYLDLIQPILIDIGVLFQIQDDYLDVYGDPKVIGKQPSDIPNGKCTWLIVYALEKANERQKRTLQECYGSRDEDKLAAVKNVYEELAIQQACLHHRELKVTELLARIDNLPPQLPKQLIGKFVTKTNRREE